MCNVTHVNSVTKITSKMGNRVKKDLLRRLKLEYISYCEGAMKIRRTLIAHVLGIVLWLLVTACFAQDPNLHIYLAFGQSNMSGVAPITEDDFVHNSRFLVLRSVDNSSQKMGEFYMATPPLGNSGAGIGPMDFFGRAMVDALPDSISVAVANVSIGGQSIDLFDKDRYQEYLKRTLREGESWWEPFLKEYGGNLYQRIVDLGNIAKRKGVIKGILFHQGEADAHRDDWPARVRKVYRDLMADLELDSTRVPFLMGEFVTSEVGGQMGWRNPVVARAVDMIPNAHLISAEGCPGLNEDGIYLHFTREGYEMLGKRYAETMLRLLNKSYEPRKGISFNEYISMQQTGRHFSIWGAPANARIKLFDLQGHMLGVLGGKGGELPPAVCGRTIAVVESSKRILARFVFDAD